MGRARNEKGFTLIELMVVVMIIAILIAIAIPTFLGAKTRAQDKAAQSNLKNGFIAAKAVYTDQSDFTLATPTKLAGAEPSLSFVDASTASTGAKNISVDYSTATQIIIAAKSSSGTCFYLKDIEPASGGTDYNSGTGTCSAGSAPTSGWTNQW